VIDAALDPARLRRDGHALIDLLTDALERWARGEGPVLPWREPADQVRAWQLPAAPEGPDALLPLITEVVRASHGLHHPRYLGHQVSAPYPAAALADLVSALLNNGGAVYEMGPVSTAMEQVMVGALAGTLGLPAGTTGVFTSGGSLGNLTALLAARQARAGFDVWREGVRGGPPLALLTGAQAHYSVARAAAIMGLGDDAVVRVPVDERFRLRAEAVPAVLADLRARGRRPLALVASACSTATGAFDPLEPLAELCARESLWLHVDGAHGASLALSSRPERRALLAGIARADSVVWDAHKLLGVPALCTAVLFRDAAAGRAAFAQEASYLFADGGPPWWDVGGRTLECTKLMMVLKLYVLWRTLGPAALGEHVDRLCDLAARFAARLEAARDFELATPPDCDIVCFRYTGAGGALDDVQARVRAALLASGRFYVVQTRLPRGLFLRVTIINPRTSDADLAALLDEIRGLAG
jgi:L-2,4-diaminobutyrate decarboxylase